MLVAQSDRIVAMEDYLIVQYCARRLANLRHETLDPNYLIGPAQS